MLVKSVAAHLTNTTMYTRGQVEMGIRYVEISTISRYHIVGMRGPELRL